MATIRHTITYTYRDPQGETRESQIVLHTRDYRTPRALIRQAVGDVSVLSDETMREEVR